MKKLTEKTFLTLIGAPSAKNKIDHLLDLCGKPEKFDKSSKAIESM
jgi:hypothetical protein